VAREKRLYIQHLGDDDNTQPIQQDFKRYRIFKLIMSWNDDKMFALGALSANHKIFLLEISVPRAGSVEKPIKELGQLQGLSDNDEFTIRLSREENDNYVLVAGLVSSDRRAIYRIRVSSPEVERQ
jgi:hypothetical protein